MSISAKNHDQGWDERLQDWLDDDLPLAEHAAFQAHLANCAVCQRRLGELTRLDAILSAASPKLSLDASFDQKLLARIEAADEKQRAAARQRAKQEFEQSLRLLSKRWRRSWAILIPGVIGGIGLAFAAAVYFDTAQIAQSLMSAGMGEFSRGIADMAHLAITSLVGAAIGIVVSLWVAPAAD